LFIPNDPITEIVTHFIGHFEVRAEDLRYRSQYDQFWKDEAAQPDDAEVSPRPLGFRDMLSTKSLTASVDYAPSGHAIVAAPLVYSVVFHPLSVFVPSYHARAESPFAPADVASAPGRIVPSDVEPGSTILVASQVKTLMDDDVVVVGSYEYEASPRLESHAELAGMTAQGLQVSSSLNDLTELQNVNRMLDLVEDAAAMIRALSEEDFGPVDSLFLKVADRIDGHYGNGAPADQLPSLEDLMEQRLGDPAETTQWQDTGTDSITIDASTTPTTMNVSSGGNLSWNEAAIVNAGLAPAVVVVAGDYHRVDAIYQTNVLRDLDAIDARWPGEIATMGGNIVQNSASFIGQDYATKTGATQNGTTPAEDGFPTNWNVTTVEGDITFLSWVFQYNFTSDHDTQILTAMGTNTFISTGLNLGFNLLSFANLGKHFDMVIVGGSLYDGNFISQTNVLLDSDTLSVWGDSSASQGSVSTGDNVLWNEASIENVGPDAWTVGLPSHYQQAVDRLSQGDREMPDGFKTDAALDGFGNLKVLYIAGNVYDIHTITQVNVVGDADNLALYEENLLKAQDSVWEVTTGGNMLVNKATIVDYDSVGQTAYVGGNLYSDAVLVQAEIIEGSLDRLVVRGNELVNEVIAFLDDPTDLSGHGDDMPTLQPMTDPGTSYDTFQSVFA
jgi:hypothetical protein